jgi:hypothetical protein
VASVVAGAALDAGIWRPGLGPLGIVARPSAGMLLRELGLPMDTFSAVLEAVQQGRWWTARNPKAYVKTVARIQEDGPTNRRPGNYALGNQAATGGSFSMEELLEAARARSSSVARKGADGIWRRGEGWGDEDRYEEEDDPHTHLSYRDRLLSNLPNDLKRIEEPSEKYKGLPG